MLELKLRNLKLGDVFRFYHSSDVWIARGNCWFGHPTGYDGGPWRRDSEEGVVELDLQGRELPHGGMLENPDCNCYRSFP